ncbi:unnamed protein product [Heligmosomoides polygyrus]|uniref:Uncharacterized protein n=1 Tax=Heligmosomoides polygyrus TaxID=6339 RepID=A0A183FFH8_HELPZ|nr:unnamed protein product [Heligmosomoides polygyrus]
MSRVRHREVGLKPRDAYGTAAYASRAFFELNHERLLANYVYPWRKIAQVYDILSWQRARVWMGIKCPAPGIRRRAEDSSKVRRDSENLMKMSFNVRQDSKDMLQMSSNVGF